MVFVIEGLSAMAGVVMELVQTTGSIDCEVLLAPEKLGRPTLSGVSINRCGLVFEVEDEPQLDARVRHHDLDAVLARQPKSLGNVRVDIAVEHAPDGVVGSASTAAGLPLRFLLSGNSPMNKRDRGSAKGVDSDDDVVSKVTSQREKVAVLGLRSFDQHQQFRSQAFLATPARWSRGSPWRHY